ncbi:uncharacterized protein LOC115990293 [Quercus lobata]|uniref:uncharacterized protein LOC115990293 n=1 Tax=Quercus lobata TaxID=97700 RepID=UPI0012474733|nr:uncharacterized protein LOC115990293 [Quercus lobata]
MAPTQKLPSKLEGAHNVKVEVVEPASNQPSIVLEDLHLGEVKEVKTTLLPMVHKVQGEIILIPHIDFVIPNEFDMVEFKALNIIVIRAVRLTDSLIAISWRRLSRATSPGHQGSRDASSNPHRDRQSAPAMQTSSIQNIQSMAAAMAELTRQNQELRMEINLRRQTREEREGGEQTQSRDDRENTEIGSQLRGTTSRAVPHLKEEMDQMRRFMEEMKENMRRTNPIEDLVHRTDSPFTASINGHPLPSKFKMPSLDSYDGTRDPFDHIATFKTTMHLQEVPDEIMCRVFPTTLKGPAQVWFSKIPPNSVSSFEELSKLFVNNFIGGQRHKRSSSNLLTIEQGENESLRSFITRFNIEALSVDEADDKLLLAAFHNGVNSDLFIHKLYEKEPQSMAELVHSAQNFMNAEDAIIAKKRKRSERVLMQIKDDPSLKWLEKMRGDPNKCNRNKYCRFHRDHGHDTNECFDLKQQIENLIRQGKLRNFLGRDNRDEKMKGKMEESSRPPLGEIRVIIGGSSIGQSSKSKKAYLKVVQSVQLSGRSPRVRSTDEAAITFTDEDAERIHHPHDDALIITLMIADYTTRRMLVDNGSSADILYYPAFQQIRLGRDQLRPVNSPLVGFGGMKVPVDTISLSVVVGAYP